MHSLVALPIPFFFPAILLGAALVILGLASYSDFKSRQVADELSIFLLGFSLATRLIWSVLDGSPEVFLTPFLISLGFLCLSLVMYYLRQWGGGDLLILTSAGAAIGSLPEGFLEIFALHNLRPLLPFALSFLLNILFTGALYGILWILYYLLTKAPVQTDFIQKVKKYWIFSFIALFLSLSTLISEKPPINFILALVFPLFIVFLASKSVEELIFIKKVKISELKVEDWINEDILAAGRVIVPSSTPGLTKHDISLIQRASSRGLIQSRFIAVKEGIPFVPVFPLALLATLLFSDPFSHLLALLI